MTEPEPGRGGRRTRPLRAADRPLKAQGRPAARRPAEAAPPPPPRARVHAEPELVCLGVSVRFGGLSAVDEVDLEVRAGEIVGLLELGCMLALRPQLLLLDEPASGISQKETESLGPLLRRIKEQTGCTMLVIEHDMPLVMGLSDYVYCLDAGRNLAEGPPEVVQADDRVIEAYLGTAAERRKVAAEAKG